MTKGKFKLSVNYKKLLADTITPVSVYLKIRDRYPNSLLLESSDYNSRENSFSYICFNPIASIKVDKGELIKNLPNKETEISTITKNTKLEDELQHFVDCFQSAEGLPDKVINGLFGYTAYNAVKYFEDVKTREALPNEQVPDLCYFLYQNVIAIDHFKNEAYVVSNYLDSANDNLDKILALIQSTQVATYNFALNDAESCDTNEQEFKEGVRFAKQHCQRGDVFQMVLSRRFRQRFLGDDFNVYRALRSINPSPYLFYFDFGNYKLFGSSPEAHLVVANNKATIHPIAGTFKKTGDRAKDKVLAKELSENPKENAEHTMLVDLARNDLSRNGENVVVEEYKTIQRFSHVIHMVSKVTADKKDGISSIKLLGDTFPAGTLSGAPKVRAMELIHDYEKESRGFYGGAIGYLGFNGDLNHAIMIRSFMSKDNTLHYQAGAGVVIDSEEEKELQEVDNKLAALRNAVEMAQDIA